MRYFQKLIVFCIAMTGCITVNFASTSLLTSNLSENVMVLSNCNITTANVTLSFGSYDPTAIAIESNLDSMTTFSVRCTKGTSASISLSNGLNANGSVRRMTNSIGSFLNYQLYTDASRSNVWNNINTYNYVADNFAPQTFSIYGRIPGGQDNVSAGSYSDAVVITVTF